MITPDISHMSEEYQAAFMDGAREFAREVRRRATNWSPRRHAVEGRVDPELAARYVLMSYDLLRELLGGEWPKGGAV